MKTIKIKLSFFFLLGLLSIISSKIDLIGNNFIIKEANFEIYDTGFRYGDMYRFARVSKFNELIPYQRPLLNSNNIDSSEIIVIGDSFFESVIEGERLAVNLEKISGKKTFDPMLESKKSVESPLVFLNAKKINNSKRRILVLESAERYAMDRAIKTYNIDKENGWLSSGKKYIKDVFSLSDVDNWLRYNIIFKRIMESKADLFFDYFKRISDNTPKYSLNPNYLFYKEEIDFSYKNIDQAKIESAAEEILKLHNKLRNEYNIDLVYLIIPNKYSLYGAYADINFKYNGFITQMTKLLSEKKINTFDTYNMYKTDSVNYYYSNDTHFNRLGRDLLIKNIIQFISYK